jgi:type IV pilus assembly protein PilE
MHGRKNRRRPAGLTLIELVVVLAVVAILAAIVYPTYQDAVRKARRAEARAALLQVMQQQERYYSQRNTYLAFSSGASDADARRFKWFSGNDPASSAYEISGAACSGGGLQDCIQLKAEPGTAKVDAGYKDLACGTLTLSSTGIKGAKDAACWK